MKRHFLVLGTLCMLMSTNALSFCGFFVAKSDAKIFNENSTVVFSRYDDKSIITMSQNYSGDPIEFAMVIPVPVVLNESQIRTTDQYYVDMALNYSAPRVVEYFDLNPCAPLPKYETTGAVTRGNGSRSNRPVQETSRLKKSYGVKIEAQYSIDEYEIIILSAEESDGLERYLNDNNYKIPIGAKEVLTPYVKSNMKFFLAKVDPSKLKQKGKMSPIQIEFKSKKFMLPIRLGMANSQGVQNMNIIFLTATGRVETTNYKQMEMPSNVSVPSFIDSDLDRFYKRLFDNTYADNKSSIFLEYAWNLSRQNRMKCDPCVSPPVPTEFLAKLGATWSPDQLFFTRLRVRYDRKNFPQDLLFQETTDMKKFQCRYVVNRPAQGPFKCDQAPIYFKKVLVRRKIELQQMEEMTGLTLTDYPAEKYYTKTWEERYYNTDEGKKELEKLKREELMPMMKETPKDNSGTTILLLIIVSVLISTTMVSRTRLSHKNG